MNKAHFQILSMQLYVELDFLCVACLEKITLRLQSFMWKNLFQDGIRLYCTGKIHLKPEETVLRIKTVDGPLLYHLKMNYKCIYL